MRRVKHWFNQIPFHATPSNDRRFNKISSVSLFATSDPGEGGRALWSQQSVSNAAISNPPKNTGMCVESVPQWPYLGCLQKSFICFDDMGAGHTLTSDDIQPRDVPEVISQKCISLSAYYAQFWQIVWLLVNVYLSLDPLELSSNSG